jgi:hypothetical protein
MAIEKFRFVSPGVQVNEIDDSILTPVPPAVGPVIIGNTVKGPLMQPVMVSSKAELERVFGPAVNGNVGATDVWRTGTPTSPTFATYAASAFLQNSGPVTVIRLAGAPMNGTQTGLAGWSTNKVYQLCAKSGSNAVLVGNIYASGATTVNLSASALSSSYSSDVGELYIGSKEVKFSLDPARQDFIRNVLNTNPSKYDSSLPGGTGYFLGETFENSLASVAGFTEIFLTSSATMSDFTTKSGSVSAESAVIIDDLVSGSNTYNELFKFVGLDNGSYLSKDIKISIENVRASKNLTVTKYGTFDVVVRKLFETSTSTVVERFAGVTLDPRSDNYIVRRIGDSYRRWDHENLRYVEYGSFANRSTYVRVQLADNDIPATALPHGFLTKGTPVLNLSAHSLSGSYPGASLFNGSYTISAAKNKRFGLLSDSVENADLVDILSHKPTSTLTGSGIFHSRFINKTGNDLQYTSGSYNTYDVLLGSNAASGSVLGFDLPIYGGFDARDITVMDSFINDYKLSTGDENSNPAYRAIKQAIDTVAQVENIDMNILCVPGLQNKDLTNYMVEVCKTRGDSLAIIDLEGDYRWPHDMASGKEDRNIIAASVVSNLEERQIDSSYGAAYFPAVFVPTAGIFMPASIAALGAIAGTEGREALWFAPAGFNRGGLTVNNAGIGVSRTVINLVSSDRDVLYDANINPIATFPNEGVVIFGQKTLQVTPSALDRVNVRRLVNFIKKEISRASTRILFEPNVEQTWNRFKNAVDPFLQAIKNNYGLEDAKIVLDETTTTADLIDRNTMYCKIYIKPTRAIEYIAIDFVVTNSGAAFSE